MRAAEEAQVPPLSPFDRAMRRAEAEDDDEDQLPTDNRHIQDPPN